MRGLGELEFWIHAKGTKGAKNRKRGWRVTASLGAMVASDALRPAYVTAALHKRRTDTGRKVNYTPAFFILQVFVGENQQIFSEKILEKNCEEDDIEGESCE